jgi:uracil-DNA glycosylase
MENISFIFQNNKISSIKIYNYIDKFHKLSANNNVFINDIWIRILEYFCQFALKKAFSCLDRYKSYFIIHDIFELCLIDKKFNNLINTNVKPIIFNENNLNDIREISLYWSEKTKLENIITVFDKILETKGWKEFFDESKNIIKEIDKKLSSDYDKVNIWPTPDKVFYAMLITPLTSIKVIIIGADPYPSPNVAMGLAFSHMNSYGKIQPSLKNIYKELIDCGYKCDLKSGNLIKWAKEGVFLINTALTVRERQSKSHYKIWEQFTSNLFTYLSQKCDNLVIIMWGLDAKSYKNKFNKNKHKFLESGHPSPLNTTGDFFGEKHFLKANEYLKEWGKKEIDWNLV